MGENDRELLELAAKAAGINGEWVRDTAYMQERYYFNVPYDNHGMLTGLRWSPLTDDGDALRLAVKLGFIVDCEFASAMDHYKSGKDGDWHGGEIDDDDDPPYAATRRAIVRAAAEIGKAMP